MSSKAQPSALLNTAEAARFLRVSEASIRRWSDSGLLGSHRVGRRRERRFREADLVRFLERQVHDAPARDELHLAGLSVSLPVHLAPLYSTDAGRLRLTVPFLADGLREGRAAFLVASGSILADYIAALEREPGVDLAGAAARGRFTVVRFKGGNVADALAQWEGYFAEAVAVGPTLIRIVGEMSSEREMFVSEEEMLRYEEAFELMCRRYPVAVMCQYDVREFDGETVLRALKAHPDMYAFRIGAFLN